MLRTNSVSIRQWQRAPVDKSKNPQFWADWDARIAARDRAAQALKVENWPHTRQLALLMIFRSDGAKACMDAMQPLRVGQNDFAFLRNAGYAFKLQPPKDRFHNLTKDGFDAAKKCILIVAKRHGLHLISYDMDSYTEHKVRCTCGWHQSLNRRNNEDALKYLQTRAERHLAEVAR